MVDTGDAGVAAVDDEVDRRDPTEPARHLGHVHSAPVGVVEVDIGDHHERRPAGFVRALAGPHRPTIENADGRPGAVRQSGPSAAPRR